MECIELNPFMTEAVIIYIDLFCKPIDWFLYDNGLRHERVDWLRKHIKKIRSSQPAIPVLNLVKHPFFPVSIVNKQL